MSKNKYPPVKTPAKVGTYSALAKSGGGYFYDEILEYRVWVHSLGKGKDYFSAFTTYEEALEFSEKTKGAESPLVLILQKEYINEPRSGVFEHMKQERIAEWLPEWLEGRKRRKNTIPDFFKKNSK